MAVMLSVVEVGLFCNAHLCNIIFFYAAGRVMYARREIPEKAGMTGGSRAG